MKLYHDITQRFRRLLSQPAEHATRWHKAARLAWDLSRYCARQLYEDRASEIAAALTYRTIFSLVPFFVLALIVFRAFGGFEAWGEQIQERVYDYLGLGTVAVHQIDDETDAEEPFATQEDGPPPQPDASAPDTIADPPANEGQEQLMLTLDQVFDDLNNQIAEVSFTSIGVVGIVLLIWAALALAMQLEDSFNQVYRAATGRAWHLRIAVYWSLITLGPVLLALSIWLTGAVVDWISGLLTLGEGLAPITYVITGVIGWALGIVSQLAAFLATWLLLFLLYVLMPNTTVHLRPAAVGSMIAAALWEIAKALFALYVNNAVGYTALYGTLALIPLFLFWVYVTWLIVLFGLELTYTLQTLKGRRLREVESNRKTEHELLVDPRWVIPIMTIVGNGFEQGQAVSVGDIHEQTTLPPRALTRLTDQLQREGLLHQVQDASAGGECQFTLARPPELIPIQRLLDLGQTMANNLKPNRRIPAQDLLTRLTRAEHAAAEQVTLAHVLQTPSASPGPHDEHAPTPAKR